MRSVIVFAVLGLALGLAAQKLPRVLGQDDSVDLMGDTGSSQSSGQPATRSQVRVASLGPPSVSSGSATKPAGHEPAREQRSQAPAPNIAANANPTNADPTLEAIERLRAAGFSTRRSRELLLREAELRDEAIKAEYAATGTIRPLNASARSVAGQRLRKELGDDVYEKYLEATRRPTRVRVGDVEAGSAAANAGILSGDEIVSYAGRRVFDLGELNAMMLETSIGETVPTTVVRDGQKLTLYVTGGPLGISQRTVR